MDFILKKWFFANLVETFENVLTSDVWKIKELLASWSKFYK